MSIAMLFLVGCAQEDSRRSDQLRIGVLPDSDRATLLAEFEPLIDYLSEELELECVLVIPDDYAHLLALFGEESVDLAFFGGLTFVKAKHQFGADPIVMRDIDLRFTTTFVARESDSDAGEEPFRGRRLAFGSRLSTSGHLMPRHFLMERNIDPESYFSEIVYSGAHDKTVSMVLDGEADLGAANSVIAEKFLQSTPGATNRLRVVWITPPYPDYVWAMQKSLPSDFKRSVAEAFLNLTPGIPAHEVILSAQSAGGYLPVRDNEFETLESIANQLELLDDR